MQVFGQGEHAFVSSIDPEKLQEPLERYFNYPITGIVFTHENHPPEAFLQYAVRNRTPVFVSSHRTSKFINVFTDFLDAALAPQTLLHGTLVEVSGVGILIQGKSGVGKSEAALDLILKGHRLVADDIVEVTVRAPDTVWGSALEMHQHHMEIRGMGILNITHLFGVAAVRDNKKIEVVVELSEIQEDDYDRLGTEQQVWPILGVDVPLARIPLRPGRNIASLIEVVARNQLLKYRGHDSAREFQEKINARIAASARGVAIRGTGTIPPRVDVPVAQPRQNSQAMPIPEVE